MSSPAIVPPRRRGDLPTIRRRIELLSFGFAVVAFAFWFGMVLNEPHEAFRIDVFVYRGGVEAILAGRPLYEPVYGPLFFVYPPFAALLFLPMALLNDTLLSAAMISLNLLLVIWTVGVTSREARGAGTVITRGTAACLGIGFTFLLVPLADTMWLGQINILLMALVVADLIAVSRGAKWAGIAIGIAAGIKLTPLLFVVLLLWSRRWRPAGLALGTFAVTVALGFVALPRDALTFWTVALTDTRRIAPSEWIVNQSFDGVVARFWPDAPGWVWLVGAALVCGLAILLGGRLLNRRLPILAAAVVGVASAFAAPFSWEHHWIWLVILCWWPLCAAIVGFVNRDRRWPWWAAGALFVTLLTARYDDGHGRAIGVFAFGGDDPDSLWTMAYPLGAVVVLAALTVAELIGHPSRTPQVDPGQPPGA
ncbi:DUF2029 domain-containing protein [Propioniciclava coleopterorum]|uniref:DUF2029 domain-containing protein n=1 Tax=Propioniciclava coleopterorum TaxID=2714937 RepID=A0A6G7Y700_9ACTN|nr:glycosyltransferase 87 family protein [Propioniciclava coleopterorum]QIK72456.1 DUF2029 domain-containing protein [Propioniciclava coleopterorum]